MTSEKDKPEEENSTYCIFVILMTEIPIAFLFGINISALNSSTPAIEVFINDTYTSRYGTLPSASTVTLILTIAQSVLLWGTLAGSFLSSMVLTKLSRKGALYLVHGVNIFSCILMGPIARYVPSYEFLIAGRFVAGMVRGISFSVFAVVVAETTCRRRLGFYQSPYSPLLFVSAAIGAGLGHPKVLGTPELWMWIVCVPALGSIIYFCASPWIPETPVSLLQNEKYDEAFLILRKFRENDEIETEFTIMQKEVRKDKESISIMTILRTPALRRQLFTTIIVMNGGQFTGVQAIVMYSDSQLLAAGVLPELVTFVSMALFLQCVIAYVVAVPIQRKFGTKKVLVIGLYIVSASYVAFIISNALKTPTASYVAVVSMCVAVFGMYFGPQFSLLALPAELTTANSRPSVIYYSGCIVWIIGGTISFIFPYSLATFGAFSYLPFLALTIALIPFIMYVVPETHKRTAEEIQSSFRKMPTQNTMLLQRKSDEQSTQTTMLLKLDNDEVED